jgi:hypothetical protein
MGVELRGKGKKAALSMFDLLTVYCTCEISIVASA